MKVFGIVLLILGLVVSGLLVAGVVVFGFFSVSTVEIQPIVENGAVTQPRQETAAIDTIVETAEKITAGDASIAALPELSLDEMNEEVHGRLPLKAPDTEEDKVILKLEWEHQRLISVQLEEIPFAYTPEIFDFKENYLKELKEYLRTAPESDYKSYYYQTYFHEALMAYVPLEGKEAALKFAEDYAGQPGMAGNKLLQESSKKNAEIMINAMVEVAKNFGVEFPLER